MSIEWVLDKEGVGMRLKKTSKNRYTGMSFDIEAVENMANVKLRPDDVIICSYAKTGIHWLWENVRMLVTGEIKTDSVEKESSMMEYHPNVDGVQSPRILNNHGFFDEQPSDLLQGNNKLILLYRNPKDVAVSFYHHHIKFPSLEYTGTFDNFLHRFADGLVLNSSYFEYLLSFEKGLKNHPNIPVLLVRYEDLHKEPVSERRKIAEFLGKSYKDDFLKAVHEGTLIDVMRENKSTSSSSSEHSSNVPDVKSVMYRKGKVGGWKETFTANQSAWFDHVISDVMGGSEMFEFVYDIIQ